MGRQRWAFVVGFTYTYLIYPFHLSNTWHTCSKYTFAVDGFTKLVVVCQTPLQFSSLEYSKVFAMMLDAYAGLGIIAPLISFPCLA